MLARRLVPPALALCLVLAGAGCRGGKTTPGAQTPSVGATATIAPTPSPTTTPAPPSRFGVLASGDVAARPEAVGLIKDLGAGWVRVNVSLDGSKPDYASLLDAGVNLVVTLSNRDPANVDATYGAPPDWPNAGFPFKSRDAYQSRVREAIAPALPYLAQGRQVWVQAENEISDASINPKALYWRGTEDQYLTLLDALYDAVKAVDSSIPVVLSSFASESLDAALDRQDQRHDLASAHLAHLLIEGRYDDADLHFYGCVQDIAAKVQWVASRLPAGQRWISTENGGPDSRCQSTPLTWDKDPARFEELQAQQVPARLSACAAAGGSICLWFSLFDLRRETDAFAHLGLIDTSATPPRKKPAYAAFRTFASQ